MTSNGGTTLSPNATIQLQSKSNNVTFNESKITSDIQDVNTETLNDQTKERQTYLVLKTNNLSDIPTGEVTSVRGGDGVDGLTTIDAIKGTDPSREGSQYIGNLTQVLLGTVHSHNTAKAGMTNESGTSELDKNTSKGYGVPIYAIDSYTGNQTAPIGSVFPNGKAKTNISSVGANAKGIANEALKVTSGIIPTIF